VGLVERQPDWDTHVEWLSLSPASRQAMTEPLLRIASYFRPCESGSVLPSAASRRLIPGAPAEAGPLVTCVVAFLPVAPEHLVRGDNQAVGLGYAGAQLLVAVRNFRRVAIRPVQA
jgi:hypothetical protein